MSAPTVVGFPLRTSREPLPLSEYAEHRAADGLVRSHLPNGTPVWLVTRHCDVRAVLTHPGISADPTHEGFPDLGATLGVPTQEQIPGWFVGLDPPEHDRFRKVLIPEFTVRRVREMRPAIEAIVDQRIDAMLAAGPGAELVEDLALPVPSLVISSLLGVPPADRDFFESRTRTLVAIRASTDEQRETAMRELLRYINRLITIKRRWPGDDMTSRLLATGVLTETELSGVLLLLLIAGHETTANNIGLGVLTLLSNPRWIGDDRVVEELLRLHSVADMVALRVAVDDLELGGQTIRRGEGIIPALAAANHDEQMFGGCPREFDPERANRRHLAFGYGVHQCLGQNLVRAEMEIVYRRLFERLPTLALADDGAGPAFKLDGVLLGLHELPIRW